MKNGICTKRLQDEGGAILVLFALLLVVLLSFAALAVDIGHLAVVRNELQNAADAGALAGARNLYLSDGTVNPGANKVAYDTARQNASDGSPVDITWTEGTNGVDIQRGHWSFTTKTFTPSDSLTPVDIWDYTTEELDAMNDFINAVRVVARREDQPAASFLAQIMGFKNFKASAEAIAYLGFTGDLLPGEIDQPIAICQDSIKDVDGNQICNIGRLINSSTKEDSNTGAWTNYSTGESSCPDSFDANDLTEILTYDKNHPERTDCDGSNDHTVKIGGYLSLGGGQTEGGYDSFRQCGGFYTDKEIQQDINLSRRDEPWELTLPVVDCSGISNPSGCLQVVGAVKIKVVQVTGDTSDTLDYGGLPERMGDWPPDGLDMSTMTNQQKWESFVDHFNLEISPDVSAKEHYYAKTIYAMRECEPYEPIGRTSNSNYGILAKIPVLVQ